MDKLPNGWRNKELAEVAEIITGNTPPKNDSCYYDNGTIPFVKPPDLGKGIVFETTEMITEKGLSKSRLIPKNSIMVCCIGSLGKIGIAGRDLITNQQINSIVFNPTFIEFRFGYYFSLTLEKYMNETANKAVVAIVNKSTFSKYKIPLPPLSEQTRIVNKLDSLFERIDKSIALLEENIKHTEALMASVLEEVLTSSKDSIEISKLVVKTENINPQNNPETIYTYIDISSVNNKTHIIENPSELQGKDAPSRARKSVVKGDIVFATTRPNLRNIAVIDSDYLNPIASTGFCVLRANSGASKDFLFLCLLSNNIQEQIKPFIRGAQYPAISDKDLLQCKIPKLNFEEQIKVSGKVMRIREKLALLSSEQQYKLSYLKALKASLLDKAFKGEL